MTGAAEELEVQIPAGRVTLLGNLRPTPQPAGAVLFAHGSGSSRHSSRNRYVAEALHDAGLSTLLFDLLTEEEESVDVRTAHLRFDIPLLAERLVAATSWIRGSGELGDVRLGYFGASTGGGAALVAAAGLGEEVAAVVSRGGRPDLAGDALGQVTSPTLLIVGGDDLSVIEMNRDALKRMRCKKRLEIVPGASHLFEEPGALQSVARLARAWFEEHLVGHGGGIASDRG